MAIGRLFSRCGEPGTGYRIKEDLIEKLTVKKETLRA